MKLKILLFLVSILMVRIHVKAQSVADIVIGSPDHNTLEAALGAAGLVNTLNGSGPFTVFAPTDGAFAALPAGTVEALLTDPSGILTDILLYHVVGAKALSSDLSNEQNIVTLEDGKTVKVTINASGVFINNAQVTVADIVADNGVVHVINAVLLPPNTVADIIIGSPDHNTLEAALGAAGLVNTLNGSGPFTVFAPTDGAFAALPAGTVEALLTDPSGILTDILLYHVVGAKALSSDLSNEQNIVTLEDGKTVKVTINASGVFINNAQVTIADIVADNGVVHLINAVLLPPKTVADIVIGSPDHNTLEAALGAAGLVNTLNGSGPFTVFAPTDGAFAALPAGTVEALLTDPSGILTDILLYHVVGAKALSSDLSNEQNIVTLEDGKTVKVTISASGVFINNAKVTVADIVADNGVVHVINAVLLPPNTVADIIIGSPDHNTLEAALGAAGLVNTLNGSGPFTVFAPTDGAFAALPAGTVEALLTDPSGILTDILLYHVVGAKALSSDLSNEQNIVTLEDGKTVKVTINASGVFINNAQVTVADIVADNGVVHVINAVLLPPKTVADIVIGSPDHNTLEAALGAAGLVNTLNGSGPFTVFAPTDGAFAALPAGTVEALLTDPSGILTDILLYHVVGAKALSSDLSNEQNIVTLEDGKTVKVTINASGVFINNAQVTVADIVADNGVVHVINAVLLPPKTVADIVIGSPEHNTLEAALGAAGLVNTLNGSGPFTVFAPTDGAFAALPAGTVEALLTDPSGILTDILLYHVVGAKALSSDLSNEQNIVTLEDGKTVKVTINASGVFINNAQVTIADIVADNGVVHVINAVLLPPKTVADIVIGSPEHNTLEAALGAAGLVNTLNGSGPFTVFAPTDGAFAALPAGTVEALLTDPSGILTDILLYHVVGAKALSSDLSNEQNIVTLEDGKTVKVTINASGVFINNAQVTVADIVADNGVVHVINAVLLPPKTVADIVKTSSIHTILSGLLKKTGLDIVLNGAGQFTIFAPTDEAFQEILTPEVIAMFESNPEFLQRVLKNHVLAGKFLSSDLSNGQELASIGGFKYNVTINNSGIFINDDSQVTAPNLVAENGVVHVINKVLLEKIIINTSDNETSVDVIISPNPTNESVQIEIGNDDLYTVELISIQGQVLMQKENILNQLKIDLTNMGSGLYFVKLSNRNNSIVKKIIRQ